MSTASKDKRLLIMPGASHIALYDGPDMAMAALGPFFRAKL
ncbi:hypothetical protein [Paenirhodobacter sp.]